MQIHVHYIADTTTRASNFYILFYFISVVKKSHLMGDFEPWFISMFNHFSLSKNVLSSFFWLCQFITLIG